MADPRDELIEKLRAMRQHLFGAAQMVHNHIGNLDAALSDYERACHSAEQEPKATACAPGCVHEWESGWCKWCGLSFRTYRSVVGPEPEPPYSQDLKVDESRKSASDKSVITGHSGHDVGVAAHVHDFDECPECEAMYDRGYDSAVACNPKRRGVSSAPSDASQGES